MPVLIQLLLFFLVVIMVIIIMDLVYLILDNKAKKWINKRSDEICQELSSIGYRYYESTSTSTNKCKFIFFKVDAFYISEDNYKSKIRSKTISAIQLRKIIFKMYDTPYNEVLEPLFSEYENEQKALVEKRNKALFSDNNYKRAVKFKRPNEDK